MHRPILLTTFALLSALSAGCGSLASDTDQYEPLAVLHGELTNPDAVTTSETVRVAVVWNCGNIENPYRVTQQVEVQPVFPSKFQIELKEPPPAGCMLDPFSDVPDDDPPEATGTPGSRPQDNAPPGAENLRLAYGTIAAYDDLNGNGKLDLVSPGDASYIDRVVGANESLLLVYLEGDPTAWSELEDDGRSYPSPGYDLLQFNDSEGMTASMSWLQADSFFELAMSADPHFATMMCVDGDPGDSASGASCPSSDMPAAVPERYPAPDDPGLSCASDGQTYTYEKCMDEGVCKGSYCESTCWRVPDATNPPEDWPCTVQ